MSSYNMISFVKSIQGCIHFYIALSFMIFSKAEVNSPLTHVWGPGLNPEVITLPARYFFIQAVDHNNISYSSSLGKVFIANVEGDTKTSKPCRIWTNILDRQDGSYIVRYKLYESCENLKISIKYKDKNVANSPYKFKGPIYAENCNCPNGSLEDMLKIWDCKPQKQIDIDLSQFDMINWDTLRDKIVSHFDTPHSVSLCNYVIKNNEVYRRCYGKYVGFKMFMDNMLLSLTRKTHVPDIEFFINLGDWPLASYSLHEKFPIFSWCGSTDSYDIVMPTYDISESSLESMGRVMLDMLSVQGNVAHPWKQRISKLFWRGRDSNKHRFQLIDFSKQYPNLFNVSLTNFFFFRDEETIQKYGPKSEHVSFFTFFDYKYQILIDGTVAAYRLPYLLGGGSLIFKQDSKYYEHFGNQLEPDKHYVPVKTDLTDLVEKLNWALQNDEEAQQIAKSGRDFANANLLPKDIVCYYGQLLHNFKKLITSEIKVREDMDKVDVDVGLKDDCNCEKEVYEIKDEL